MADYDVQWRLRVEPAFGWMRLGDIKHREVQAWVDEMPSRGTAQHAARTLRAILRDAWVNEYIDAEPLRKPIRYPAEPPRERAIWRPRQVAGALESLRGCPLEPLFLLMAGGGLSLSEALAVTWADCAFAVSDRVTCAVRVDKAITAADGLKGTKNRFRTRTIAIGEPFSPRLMSLRGEPQSRCYQGNPRGVWRRWKSCWEPGGRAEWHGCLSELPYISIGRLRAVHETMMQSVVPNDSIIARQHGRSNVCTGYRHYQEPDAAPVARKIAGLFGD